jgi:DNA-binding transcriptional regulator PaaX
MSRKNAPTAAAAATPRTTKAALLRELVATPGGASLTRLIDPTGWQAHTVRAALSGLRKQGVALERRREGSDTIYSVAAADPASRAAKGVQ